MVDSLNKALSILLTSPNIRLSFIVQRVRQGIENNKAESYVRLTRLTSNIDKGKGHEDKGPYKLLRISSNNETDDVSSFSSHSTYSAPNLISTGASLREPEPGKDADEASFVEKESNVEAPTIASEEAAGLEDVIKECWGSREELQNNTKERINRCRRGIL
ncbi:hypothetical protein HID58_022420, partial [Brassica napus]